MFPVVVDDDVGTVREHETEERLIPYTKATLDMGLADGWPDGESQTKSQKIYKVVDRHGATRYFYEWSLRNAKRGATWWERSPAHQKEWWAHFSTTNDSIRRAVQVQDDTTVRALRRDIARQLLNEEQQQLEQEEDEEEEEGRKGEDPEPGTVERRMSRLRLLFHGRDLDDDEIMKWTGISEGDVISVCEENIAHRVVANKWFDRFILIVIIANTVSMIMQAENPNENAWQDVETVFTIVFIVEMALKWVGYGVPRYFHDVWNWLDFGIVLEGAVSLAVKDGSDTGLSALRVVRTLRPLRAAAALPELQVIIRSLISSIPRIVNTLQICALFFLVFSIAGLQWFNGEFRNRCFYRGANLTLWELDETVDHLCGYRECPARVGRVSKCDKWSENPNDDITSFDNIGDAALTIFQSTTLEGWVQIMNFGQDTVGDATWVFFVLVILFGNFVLINLLMGVIVTEYDDAWSRSMVAQERKDLLQSAAQQLWESVEESAANREDVSSPSGEGDNVNALSRNFERLDQLICGIICLNVALLCTDHYDLDRGDQDQLSSWMNTPLTCIFALELLLKVPYEAYLRWSENRDAGNKTDTFCHTVLTSPRCALAYFFKALNQVDAAVVVLGFVEMLGDTDVAAASVFRGIRLVRLVKLSRHLSSMQEVCSTIAQAWSSIVWVTLLLIMFIVIFSVAGMQIFAGKLVDDQGIVPRNNFDSFHWAFVSTFQVLAGENWPALMYSGAQVSFPLSVTFYLTWLLVGQFVTVNLFMAVLFAHFDDVNKNGCPDWKTAEKDVALRKLESWWDAARPRSKPETGRNEGKELGDIWEALPRELSARDKDYLHLVKMKLRLKIVGRKWENAVNNTHDGSQDHDQDCGKQSINDDQFRKLLRDLVMTATKLPIEEHELSMYRAQIKPLQQEEWKCSKREFLEWWKSKGCNHKHTTALDRHKLDYDVFVHWFQRPMEKYTKPDGTVEPAFSGTTPQMAVRNLEVLNNLSIDTSRQMDDATACHQSGQRKSLCLLSEDNGFRRMCNLLIQHPNFELFILIVIALSTLGLILSRPSLDEEMQNLLDTADTVFMIIFMIEALLKIVAKGLIMDADAYLCDWWNVLDFTAVIISLLGRIIDSQSTYGRVLRILRVLRTLRLVSHEEGMRIILVALARSMGKIRDVSIVVGFAYLIFALLGVSLFKGGFYRCNDPDFPPGAHRDGSTIADAGPCSAEAWFVDLTKLPDDSVVNQFDLSNDQYLYLYVNSTWHRTKLSAALLTADGKLAATASVGGQKVGGYWVGQRAWTRSDMNFDNVPQALLALIVFASGEGWPDAMFEACDIVEPNVQPMRNHRPAYAYYFVINAAAFGFFLMDLFVGAIYASFIELKQESEVEGGGGDILLTDAQKQWKDAQKKLKPQRMRPPRLFPRPLKQASSWEMCRWYIHRLVTHDARTEGEEYRPSGPRFYGAEFEILVQVLVMLNTVTMAATWHSEPQWWRDQRNVWNLIFTSCFTVELVLKLIGYGVEEYFQDNWNCFDFVLTVGSLVDAAMVSFVNMTVFRTLRLFRVARLLRLINSRGGAVTLLKTLWLSIPALLNVAGLLLLLFTFYAVLGVSLFGELPRGDVLIEHNNFENWATAMLTLIRISTGEDWQTLMYACYPSSVGSAAAVIYFVTFIFLAMFILMNMFVAIICDAMDEMSDSDQFDAANDRIVQQFTKQWIEHHLQDKKRQLDHRWLELHEPKATETRDGDDHQGLSWFLSSLLGLDAKCYRDFVLRADPSLIEHSQWVWYQTKRGTRVRTHQDGLEHLKRQGVIDGGTLIVEDEQKAPEPKKLSRYTIWLHEGQLGIREELRDLIRPTGGGSTNWSDHRVAQALHLHVSRRWCEKSRRWRHCVTFSDLLVSLTCLFSQENLRKHLQSELKSAETTPEDRLEQDLEPANVIARKIVAKQLESAEELRRKIDKRLVSAMHPRRLRRGFGRAAAGRQAQKALAWDPEEQLENLSPRP